MEEETNLDVSFENPNEVEEALTRLITTQQNQDGSFG